MLTGVYEHHPRGTYHHHPTRERFFNKVLKLDNGCWEWTGGKNWLGYGIIRIDGRNKMVHSVSYEWVKGLIPEGFELDHLCRNTLCVNPDHLEAVTHSENIKRGLSPKQISEFHRAKTHCPQGHPYDLFNTYYTPKGHRDCKICRQKASKRFLTKV